ncbi:MAG: hypothetical protein JSU95_19785 [Betaproteobacteria bacterium]|nr:MAG: hypothetical protein JSU95_19785 [Betaproteobacteria bacterium]
MSGRGLTGLAVMCSAVFIAWFIPQRVHGQVINVAELIRQSDAVVSVEVAFVPYGDMVLIGEVLDGEMVNLDSSNELLGQCLPKKVTIRELAKSPSDNPQQAVYAEAVERAGYAAVVFMKHLGNASEVICDDGAHSTVNWITDPRYPQWRAQLDELLKQSR